MKKLLVGMFFAFGAFCHVKPSLAQDIYNTYYPTNISWELLHSTYGANASDYYIGNIRLLSERERSYSYTLKSVARSSEMFFVYINDNEVVYCGENRDNTAFRGISEIFLAKRSGYFTNSLLQRYEDAPAIAYAEAHYNRRVMIRRFRDDGRALSWGFRTLKRQLAYHHICR